MHFFRGLALLAASVAVAAVAQAPDATPYWMDGIAHNGIASFNPDKSYTVFRNVKDYGAVGDGGTSSFLFVFSLDFDSTAY